MRYYLYLLKSLTIPIISLFIVAAGASYSFAFTAETVGNFGDVTVIGVEGDYDVPDLNCTECDIPRQIISKEFFISHGDQYDFLIIFSNFDFQMPVSYIDGKKFVARGFYQGVSNAVRGIGEQVFDNSSWYGSSGQLKGTIDMGYLGGKVTNPLDPEFTSTMTTLSHELLHQWAARVKYKTDFGNISNDLLGLDDAHWSYLLDTQGSLMYGNKWRNNGDGTFTSLPGRKYYSPLDLYLMGLIDKSEVPPMLLIENPLVTPDQLPDTGVTIEGTSSTVTINDIIAVEGERVPSVADSQKSFKFATILLVRPGTFKESELYQVRSVINNWVLWFSALTDGKAQVIPDASPVIDIPENPGVAPLPFDPRDLPAEINDAVTWLIANQKENGSWMDSNFTRHRDTIHALDALSHFTEAGQNLQNGLVWLNNEQQPNTDTLAGKIAILASNGQNIENLKNDLLAKQNPDGGWGVNRNYASNPLDTAFALAALSEIHLSDSKIISPAIAYLKARQNPDSGWGSGEDASDIRTTVDVLSAFAHFEADNLTDAIQNGLNWLYDHQNANGGFGNSPSTVYDTAMALMLLNRIGAPPEKIEGALNYILENQSKNGSWHDSPDQTALAVSSVWNAMEKPDLVINTGDIAFEPPSIATLPAEITIKAVIKNGGFTDTPETTAVLYKGAISEENQIGQQVIAIPGKSSLTVTFTDTILDGQPHYYYIVLDTMNQVAESCETNNKALKIMNADMKFDFEISDADVSLLPVVADMMQPVSITALIKNKGAANAYSVPVKFYVDGVEISSVTVDLPGGGEASKQIIWNASKAGDLNISVTVDPTNIFPGELSEDNNTGLSPITVNPSTKPNLTVSHENLTISPTPVPQGGNAKISILVENNGFDTVLNAEVRFYAGEPQQGAMIGNSVIPSLGPGESKLVEIDWTNIQVSGNTMIYVVVVAPEGIEEISIADNSAFSIVEVVSLPDLLVSPTTVVADPAIAKEGDPVKITVTVMNKGKQDVADVDIALSESGNTIDTGRIDSVHGNAQQVFTFSYDTTGKKGSHQIQVNIDPANTIPESDETNNSTVCGFAVQDTGDSWLTERYISPNGDNIKDTTRFFFKLDAIKTVKVNILNDKGEIIRTFSGGALDNCAGGEIVWDGLDETGKVAPDGSYQIRVLDESGLVVAETYAVVDNNQSPLNKAIGTPYFSQKNITCPMPGIFTYDNYYGDGDGVWGLEWFSDESGMLVLVSDLEAGEHEYPEGLYTVSPDGSDIHRLVPMSLNSWFNYGYWGSAYDLSQDEESIVFVYKVTQGAQIWTVDRYGQNLFHVTGNLPALPKSIEDISYAPDRSKIAYCNNTQGVKGLYIINADGTGHTRLAEVQYYVEKFSWSPDSSHIAYLDGSYGSQTPPKLRIVDMQGNRKIFNQFREIREVKWVNPDKLVVVDMSGSAGDAEVFNLWLVDVVGNNDPVKIAENIYNQSFWGEFLTTYWTNISPWYYETNSIMVVPENNTIAFIDNSGERFALKICDDQGNCRTLHESPKVNQVFNCQDGEFCTYSYVSMNDLRLSPDGTRLAFVDYAYKSLEGEIFSEWWDNPCSYQVYLVVIDLKTGEKRAYPFDEFNACERSYSYHVYTIENGSWSENGVLHYVWHFDEKQMDLFDTFKAPDNTYTLRIEQIGEKSAEIKSIKLNIDGQIYSPVSVINIETSENVLYQLNSGTIDAHSKTFEVAWKNIPEAAQVSCILSMSAKENNYFYRNGSLHWLGNNALTARDNSRSDDEGRIILLDTDNGEIDHVPMQDGWSDVMAGSPHGNYVTFQNDSCDQGGDIWSLSSLMNLTAVLNVRQTASAVLLEGTAMDINFDRYVLEYANIESPNDWNLVIPPSDIPVVNSQFITWVPPDEGTYYVRLTVYDKAGNQVIKRKKLSWGVSTVISGLYKTDVTFSDTGMVFSGSGNLFSPYTDSVKDAVALHYRVLNPANLTFSIYNAAGNLINSFNKAYASVPPGGITDNIIWDGKDSSGNIAEDGVYTIKVLDYEFYVELDRTPPTAKMALSRIQSLLGESKLYIGRGRGFSVVLSSVANDPNLKNWTIEYGLGPNPMKWTEFRSGTNVIGNSYTFSDDSIPFAAGKTFRLRAEDAAGNIAAAISGQLEEQLILSQFRMPRDFWGSLVININEEPPWWMLGLARDEAGNFIPIENINSGYLSPVDNAIKGLETIRLPIAKAFMQYCNTSMVWADAYKIENFPSDTFELDADFTGIDLESLDAVRVKAVDEAGNIFFSNPMPFSSIGCMLEIIQDEDCNISYKLSVYEDLQKLQFQWAFQDSSAHWNDYKVLRAASGDVIQIDSEISMPLPDVEADKKYLLRMVGTGNSGTRYDSNILAYPTLCSDPVFAIKPEYISQWCNTLCSSVSLTPDYGKEGPPSGFTKITYSLLNSLGATTQILGSTSNAEKPFVFDIDSIPVGAWQVKAELEAQTTTKTATGRLIIDNVLPQAKITHPASSDRICPVATLDQSGKTRYSISVEGIAEDNLGVKLCRLYYGAGENPSEWKTAVNLDGKPIEKNGKIKGKLDPWDVTYLPAGFYSLKLEVLDGTGNTQCDVTSGFYVDQGIEWTVSGVDKKLFSPNGDGISDDVRLTYTLHETAYIGAEIVKDQIVVQTLLPGQTRPPGTSVVVWDVFNQPDGLYDIRIWAEDQCGHQRDQKFARGIEVDNTPPELNITSPLASDPLGVIVEIMGTAMDRNFLQYRLKAVSVENPDHIIVISDSSRPVTKGLLGVWNNFGLTGSWELRLTATDKVGNSHEISVTVSLGDRQNLIRDLFVTHDLISPNHDGTLDQTEVHFELNPDIAGLYDAVMEIRSLDNVLKKTYSFPSVSGGAYSSAWNGESDVQGETIVPDGAYHIVLKASLVSSPAVSHTESITVKVDSSEPDLEIITPLENEFIKDSLEIKGSVSDENLKSYHIACTGVDGAVFSESGEQNREKYTFAHFNEVADGDYVLIFRAEDAAGNHSERQIDFKVDRTPPVINLISPSNSSIYGNNDNRIRISGTIEEKYIESWSLSYGAGENPSQFMELSHGVTLPTEGVLFEWPVGKADGIADGTYTIRLIATDKAGWTSESRVAMIIDNTPPIVDVQSPADGAYVKAIEIMGTISDAHFKSYVVELSEGACSAESKWSVIATGQTIIQGGVIASSDLLPPDNTYCVRVTAIDQLDNSTTLTRSINIDTKPPAPPVLSGTPKSKTEISLSWTQNTEPDMAGYYLYKNGSRVNPALMSDTSYNDAGLAEGVVVYTVTAVDLAGWESPPSNRVEFKVDLTGPAAKITTPRDGAISGDLADIKGTAYSSDDFKEYRVYWGDGQTPAQWILIRKSPAPVSFGILAQNNAALSDGAYYSIKLEAEDLSGNISTDSVVFMADNQAPAAPVLLSAVLTVADVAITWQANSEPDLAGYLLYRNDRLVNGPDEINGLLEQYLISGTGYVDKSMPDGTFAYQLYAVDSAGNISLPSDIVTLQIDTHPPHMSISYDKYKFDDFVTLTAQSPDLDIAEVQFQYKKISSTTWLNLDSPLTSSPWEKIFDPKSLGLPYGQYDLRAVAKDNAGHPDAAPVKTTVYYKDLTVPSPPTGLSAMVNGGNVSLRWSQNAEQDLQGYNVYRLINGTKTKLNSTIISGQPYVITSLADSNYIYAVSALDQSGNESAVSVSVSAHVYTPTIQTSSPIVSDPHLTFTGTADPQSSVELFNNGNPVSTITADSEGFYYGDITVAEGENWLSARATDGDGNISKMSAQLIVICNSPPPTPTGLAASVSGHDCLLTWDPVMVEDLSGYNLYRNGERVNNTSFVSSGTASASVNCATACLAFDPYLSTGWSSDSIPPEPEPGLPCDPETGKCDPSAGCMMSPDCEAETVDPGIWWQLELPAPAPISGIEIEWSPDAVAVNFGIQVFYSEGGWITVQSISGNQDTVSRIWFESPWSTDKIRIIFYQSVPLPGESEGPLVPGEPEGIQAQINDVRIEKQGSPITGTSYNDIGLPDHLYEYQVSSVDIYGLESPLSPIVQARIGDAEPPMPPNGLEALVSGMSIQLSWLPNGEMDLAGYRVYRNTQNGWIPLNPELSVSTEFTDTVMANGEYQYRISAVDNAGNESQPSEAVTAIVNSDTQPQPVIKDISTAPEGNAIYICWEFTEWGGIVSGFNLYRSLGPEGPFTRINNELIVDDSCYVDKAITSGEHYYYRVSAVNQYGTESAYSDPMSVLPKNCLPLTSPVILEPTVSGKPMVAAESPVDISGAAKPGATVELYQNGIYAGTTTAVDNPTPKQYSIRLDDNLRVVGTTVSPDGRQAAYLLYNYYSGGIGYELWIYDIENGNSRKIAEAVEFFRWSPQSDRIAYTVYRSEDGIFIQQIFIYDVVNDRQSELTEQNRADQWSPAWSADGNRVVFVSADDSGITDIWVKELQNGSLARLTQNTDPDIHFDEPSFSPDNRYLAYKDWNASLYLQELASGVTTCVEEGISYSDVTQSSYKWSISGNRIGYLKYEGAYNVFVYDVAGRTSLQVTSSPNDVAGFEWSADDMQIIHTTRASWVDTESGSEYRNAEIKIAPANVPNCDRALLQLDSDTSSLSIQPSGAIWYDQGQDPNLILSQWFPGRFVFKGIDLVNGENEFYALCIDASSGAVSAWSDTIVIHVDQGTIPDLGIPNDGMYCYPAAPVSGDKLAGNVKIQNIGAAGADNVDVLVYVIDQEGYRQTIASATISRIEPSSEKTYSFSWDTSGKTGVYRIAAVVDPMAEILELSENNNTIEKEIFISASAGLSMATRLDSDCYPSDTDIRMEIEVCNSGSEASGRLHVEIIDNQNDLVASVLNQNIVMPYAYHQKVVQTWNTEDTYAGRYTVKATFTNEEGLGIAENTVPFTITSDLAILTTLTTDKMRYGSDEDVRLTAQVKNTSQNGYVNSMPVSLRIMDANNNAVFSQERELGALLPGLSASWPAVWNTGLNTPGIYTALAEAHLYDGTVFAASKQFEIYPEFMVSAVLTLPSGVVTPGDMVTVGYTLLNEGNVAIDNLPLKIALLDPDTASIMIVAEDTAVDIGLNGTATGNQNFSTQGFALKQYTLLFQGILNGQTVTLASRPLLIADAAAPVVTILSPADGGTYHSKFDLTAEAKDSDSGVNSVEYSMDDGQWIALPLNDPALGKYTVGFTPSGVNVGEHIFRFRAADTKGNISSPVSATIHIQPKIDMAAEINGNNFGMNTDVPINITLKNTGWSKNGEVGIAIENGNSGESIESLDPIQADLSYDGNSDIIRTWNTGIFPPGDYAARVTLKYGGQILDETLIPFSILPVLDIRMAVETDKPVYDMQEDLHGVIRVTNDGNYPIPLTAVSVVIQNVESMNIAYTKDFQIHDLVHGQTEALALDWNTGIQPKGKYQMIASMSIGGIEVGRQHADFTITVSDTAPPVLTILSPIENGVYEKVFDLTVSAVDDVSGVETVEYQFDAGEWRPLLPADNDPGIYTASYTPTEIDEGERVISCRSVDKAGNTSTPVSVHIKIDMAVAFKSLTGTIAVSPHIVMQGMTVSYGYSVSNITEQDVRDLKIRVCIVHPDTGQIIKTLEHTATVAAQSTYTANFADPADFAPGTYNAVLKVLLSDPVRESQLAGDGMAVVERPVVTVEKTVADDIRLLVWINDNCHLTGCGWKDCIRNDLLERILKANVADYRMVFDPTDFEKELRNPYYTDILVLGDQHQVAGTACYELVERINSGTGILSGKWIAHEFALKYNDMFGVKSIGCIPGDPMVTLFDSPITAAGAIGPVGPSIRVEALNKGEIIAGRFKIDKKNKKASPAIVLNTFGRGKTVYFAFDLGMMLSDEDFEWIAGMMANVFSYIKGGSDLLPAYPWQVVPVSVSLESSGTDYVARMIETFPELLPLYDRQSGQWINNSPQEKDILLGPDDPTAFWYYYLTPDLAGVYPTETQTGILFNGEYVNLQTTSLDVSVPKDRVNLIQDTIDRISLLQVDSRDNCHKMNAKRALEWVQASPTPSDLGDFIYGPHGCGGWDLYPQLGSYTVLEHLYYSGVMYGNILNIVYAIHEVVQIRSADVSGIRYLVDTLLKIEEARYYFYDLAAVSP